MAGYIGSKTSVTIVDGYNKTTADSTFVDATGDTMTGNLSFGDNNKAIFGAGSDLQIYHDGTNSYIDDTGTGNLLLRGASSVRFQSLAGENMVVADQNGAVFVYHDNLQKLATTATGIDVTGTVTADGLTSVFTSDTQGKFSGWSVVGANGSSGAIELGQSPEYQGIISYAADASTRFIFDNSYGSTASTFEFRSNTAATPKTHMKITGGGDISFYEDTGTTAKFFWDASAESLGIGTDSPIYAADIKTSGTNNGQLRVGGGATSATGLLLEQTNSGTTTANIQNSYYSTSASASLSIKSGYTTFHTGTSGTERMRIDSSGNVGIGTSSPSTKLQVTGDSSSRNTIVANATLDGGTTVPNPYEGFGFGINFIGRDYGNAVRNYASINTVMENNSSSAGGGDAGFKTGLSFYTNGGGASNTDPSERMRIASSGNVGIGTSSPARLLHLVKTDNSPQLRITGATDWDFYSYNDSNLYINNSTGTVLSLFANKNASFGGNVGIGLTAPTVPLHVALATNTAAIFTTSVAAQNADILKVIATGSATSANIKMNITYGSGAQAQIRLGGDDSLAFNTTSSDTERMRIDSSGGLRVGLSTNIFNSPSAEKLSVKNTNVGSAVSFESTDTTGGYPVMYIRSTDIAASQTAVYFYRTNTVIGSISTTASSTAYNTSSDYRLKTDAQPMTGASARVQALKPVNFEWISTGTRVDGFLAHEAQEVVPECVTGTKDAMRDEEYEVTAAVLDDNGMVVTEAVMGTRSVPDYQGIDQSKLVPLLTAALQEALNKIDAMETRLAALEAV